MRGECNHGPSCRVCTPVRGVTTRRKQLNNRIYSHLIMVMVMSCFGRELQLILNAYIIICDRGRCEHRMWKQKCKKTTKLFNTPQNITYRNVLEMWKFISFIPSIKQSGTNKNNKLLFYEPHH